MFLQILALSSSAVAVDSCYACFKTTAADAEKLTVVDALKLTQYWDPIKNTCGDVKNDMKRNLIFKSKDAGIPKTWILNPKFCDSKPEPVDLATAERDWVLAVLSYSSSIVPNRIPLQQCLDEKYSQIADGSIPTSQAKAEQFTPLSNIGSIERPLDHQGPSMKNPGQTAYTGPIGVYWADVDDELVISWRGTATAPQLQKEMASIVQDYLSPKLGRKDKTFVDVKINDVHVGGAFDYFYSNFMDLWTDKAMDDFKARAKTAKKVRVVGHSLGGAIAKISAMYLAVELEIDGAKIEIATFGEPRGSDSTFSVNLNTLIQNQKRYVHSQDLVPHGPPMLDVNGVLNPQGKRSAFHHSEEVFLQKDFQDKKSANFSKFHSCGYDDMVNENGEKCSNSVQNFGNMLDFKDVMDMIKNDAQGAHDHGNYWPQYNSHFCGSKKSQSTQTTTASSLII